MDSVDFKIYHYGKLIDAKINKISVENKIYDLLLTAESLFIWCKDLRKSYLEYKSKHAEEFKERTKYEFDFINSRKSFSTKTILLLQILLFNEIISYLVTILNKADLLNFKKPADYKDATSNKLEISLGTWFNLFEEDYFREINPTSSETPIVLDKKQMLDKINSLIEGFNNNTELNLARNKYGNHKDLFFSEPQHIQLRRISRISLLSSELLLRFR